MIGKWDTRFLELSSLVSTWSKDQSTRVGAVIVDNANRVVSLGFNGFPRGVIDVDLPRDEKLRRTIHAEANAILFANRSLTGCAIYVTAPPCARCAAKIVQVGITRVVYLAPNAGFAERWMDEMASAAAMFDEAGIEVLEVKRD